MTVVEQTHAEPTDAELISRVRGGDVDAYGPLFARHKDAATRLARSLSRGPDADDLVSDAFSKVLNVLLRGGGPDLAFRAYLLTAVRRVHIDRIRSAKHAMPTGDMTPFDPGVPFQDTAVAGFEGGAAARAFASLPERWQMVLWHLEVEGNKPADVAPMLGMSANSVSALAYRAREGLRQAFLQMHTADLVGEDCEWTHDKLGAYVRKGLSRRDSEKVEDHLDSCRRCTAIYLELTEVNSSLAAVLGPLVLGGAAAAYLGGGGSTVALGGLGLLVGRARDFVMSNGTTVLAAGTSVGVAAATVAGIAVLHQHTVDRLATADHARPGVTAPQSPTSQAPQTTEQRPATAKATRRHPKAPVPAPSSAPKPAAPGAVAVLDSVPVLKPVPVKKVAQVSGPAALPTHAPRPGHLPTTVPTPKPPSTPGKPAPPPPPPAAVDVSLSAWIGPLLPVPDTDRLAATVHGAVSGLGGLPRGTTATVTVTVKRGLTLASRHCRGNNHTMTCTVTAGANSFSLLELLLEPGVQMQLNPIPGYTDPNPANNIWPR